MLVSVRSGEESGSYCAIAFCASNEWGGGCAWVGSTVGGVTCEGCAETG